MENLAPRLIEEAEAGQLGIQRGWYGTRVNGTLMTGPCSTREECLKAIDLLPEPVAKAWRAEIDEQPPVPGDKSTPSRNLLRTYGPTVHQIGYKPGGRGNRQ